MVLLFYFSVIQYKKRPNVIAVLRTAKFNDFSFFPKSDLENRKVTGSFFIYFSQT